MLHHPLSTLIVKRSPPVPDSMRPVLVCPSCGDTMEHLRTIPELGVRPENLVFVCPSCKEVETRQLISHYHSR